MRKMIVWTCILALASATLIAQEEQGSGYSITFLNHKKDTKLILAVSAIFADRSFAEVWMATVKMLVLDRKQIVTADKTSGFISVKWENFDIWQQFFVEDTPSGASVFFTLTGEGRAIKKMGEDMCKGIVEQLSPKAK